MASATYVHGERSKDPICRVWQLKRKYDAQIAALTEPHKTGSDLALPFYAAVILYGD